MNQTILKTITLSLLASSTLLGATPNIGDIDRQVQPPKIEKEKPTLPSIDTKEYKTPMADTGKTLFIKSFTFSGNMHIKSKQLQMLTKEYEKQNLTFTQLNELTAKITKYYRKKGYFVARAYLPQQNINDNNAVLEIAIIEGKYGEFQLKNNSLVEDMIVQGMLDDIKDKNIISTSTLERAMLLINDTPGVVVTNADVMPGSDVGTSDFAIVTKESKAYDGYIVLDNTGSEYTGKNRAMFGVNFNSPFKIGDKLSLGGLLSNGTDLRNGRVSYSSLLMSNGLRAEVSYSQTEYTLVNLTEAEDGDYTGNSKTIEVNLSYPIIRSRTENLYTNLSIYNKNLEDKFLNNTLRPREINSLKVGLDYDKSYLSFGFNTNSKLSFNLTYGDLDFDKQLDKNNDKAGANTYGNYSKINLDFTHNIFLNEKLTLENSLKMQYALGDKNLDGSEDFSLGGASGVKVYPDGEFSAENGYIFSTQLKYKLPNVDLLSSQVGVFYDRGRAFASNNDNNLVTDTSKSLQDVGVGYYASYKNFFGQVQVAWAANSAAATSEPDEANSRILFQGGWVF